MKKALILLMGVFFSTIGYAQDELRRLIGEGIVLHDKGDYEGAIVKYDAALKLDPVNAEAKYEKSYTLIELKKFQEAIELSESLLNECKDPKYRQLAFVNYGNALDYRGEGEKAEAMYNKGIKEFPDSYLLFFNKEISQTGMNKSVEAIESFQQSVTLNPMHASSHNALARSQYDKNRIPSILVFFTFLIIEPTGKRAEKNLELLNTLLFKGISKEENGNITISIDPGVLDKKKKNKDDDFSSAELVLSLMGADNSVADSLGAKTEADRLDYKMGLLTGMIDEAKKNKDKGFFKRFYIPVMVEMKAKGFVKTASYIAMQSAGNSDITEWVKKNNDKVEEFYTWFRGYWKK